jgi:hypothetical protein
MKRTSKEWLELVPSELNLKILDYDGWNTQDSFFKELITKEEFLKRVKVSTISAKGALFNSPWEFNEPTTESGNSQTGYEIVCVKISKDLNDRKIRFTMDDNGLVADFQFTYGNLGIGIMVEGGPGDVRVTYFISEDFADESSDSVEDVTDPNSWDAGDMLTEYFFFVKEFNAAETKIQNLVNKIYTVCESAQLNFDRYITIVSDNIDHPEHNR